MQTEAQPPLGQEDFFGASPSVARRLATLGFGPKSRWDLELYTQGGGLGLDYCGPPLPDLWNRHHSQQLDEHKTLLPLSASSSDNSWKLVLTSKVYGWRRSLTMFVRLLFA
jgi:hypothetical protein